MRCEPEPEVNRNRPCCEPKPYNSSHYFLALDGLPDAGSEAIFLTRHLQNPPLHIASGGLQDPSL